MESIYPVIVLYKIHLKDAMSYKTLLAPNGIDHFMVYDNSPEDYVQNTSDFPSTVFYVRDTTNSGLPKAYNLGAARAKELGYDRVLLLDQDTRFAENAWHCFMKDKNYKGITVPMVKTCQGSCFSPVGIKGWGIKVLPEIVPGEYSLYDYAVVNSGSCIPVDLFEKTGGYNEAVKLDFSDFQFQIYARRYEPVCKVLDTLAIQDFSNDCKDSVQLLNRYSYYLEGAKNFSAETAIQSLKIHYMVVRHMLSLILRTHSISFFTKYLQYYILNKY